MSNQEIIEDIKSQMKTQIERILPRYEIVFRNPLYVSDKQISIFLYDIERIVSLGYTKYHTGDKSVSLRQIPVDLKFLITFAYSENSKSDSGMAELFAKLHHQDFLRFIQNFTQPQIILESGGLEVWNKLFPESNYKPSIPVIVSGVHLLMDDT